MTKIADLKQELDRNWKAYDHNERLELTMRILYKLGMIEETIILLEEEEDDPIKVSMTAQTNYLSDDDDNPFDDEDEVVSGGSIHLRIPGELTILIDYSTRIGDFVNMEFIWTLIQEKLFSLIEKQS